MAASFPSQVHGILVLDKPTGMTSNRALQRAKSILGGGKAGHTGSLDPLACGVLPLCFGEATKVSRFLLEADKTYLAGVRLGVTTDTGDAQGKVLERREVPRLDPERITDVLAGFVGEIEQIPPMYSALKKDGRPLYSYARKGQSVDRKARKVTVHSLDWVGRDASLISIRIRCSKGTYVRTLAEDIGTELGCGAHVASLCRESAAGFCLSEAVTLDQLPRLAASPSELAAVIKPADRALLHVPEIGVPEPVAESLRQGRPVFWQDSGPFDWVRIYSGPDRIFVGVGEVTPDGRLTPRRILHRQPVVCSG